MKRFRLLVLLSIIPSSILLAQQAIYSTDSIIVKNSYITLVQDLRGGAFSSIKIPNNPINPFNWKLSIDDQPSINSKGFNFKGHFISLGTWGMPTAGEQKAGIRLYGEPSGSLWKLMSHSTEDSIKVGFNGNVEHYSFERLIKLYPSSPVLLITESITNKLSIGRLYNYLQHPTFGGAFVNENLIIETNAGKGFYQKGAYPRTSYDNLEATSFSWPDGQLPDGDINLRLTGERNKTYLTSHIFSDSLKWGWATAMNPTEGLLIGYLWKIEDYPWLNIWHQYKNGKPYGRAIEFATCGAGLSFEQMASNDYSFFGRNSFEFIDAGEKRTKSYYLFAIPIEANTTSVKDVIIKQGAIEITLQQDGITKYQELTIQN